MKNADEAGESGVSRGVDQAARYVLDIIPESAGPRRATARGSVIHSVRGPGSQTFLAKEHSAGIVLRPGRKFRASLGSDKITQYDAPVGCLVINPAGVDSTLAWSQTGENAVVSISPEALSELAAHEFDHSDVELEPPAFGKVDLRALNIAQMITAELTGKLPPDELYLDSLLTVFGVHLSRTYTGQHVRHAAASIPDQLRLDFAERLLVDGELAIAEVAYLAGFSDQSHLAATMKKYRGRTPTMTGYAPARN